MSSRTTLSRAAALALVCAGALVNAPLAQASNATLEHALKSYDKRLTADIGYLSSFAAPSRARAGAALRRLTTVRTDLAGATRAATTHQASTASGRRGRTDILVALRDATAATSDARNSATAARAGRRTTARSDARAEQRQINAAIPRFEAGGRLLHLF